METSNNIIENLINSLARMPGIGKRSATRMLFYLMQKKEGALLPLLNQLSVLATEIKVCENCFNIDVTNPCNICANLKRNHKQICIVEDISSLWAMEKSKSYTGIYFILGGMLSSIENKTPKDIKVPNLLALINKNQIEEIIFATPLTIEGQTTAYYIKEQIAESFNRTISITALAHGIPAGGEIEYLDELTLSTALKLRKGL